MPALPSCKSFALIRLLALLLFSSVVWAQSNNVDPFATTGKGFSSAFESSEFLPVDKAYVLNVEFVESTEDYWHIRSNWQIEDKYYLYRHSLKFALTDHNGNKINISPSIPAGLAKVDEYFGNVEVYYHNLDVTLQSVSLAEPATLTVTAQGCADAGLCYPPRKRYFSVDGTTATLSEIERPATLTPSDSASTSTSTGTTASTETDLSRLPYMILLALIGGMILNLMPCVLPVLSLKVLSFANDEQHGQAVHGVAYSVGVVFSFVLIAAVLISLQAAGKLVGWGFQLQSPWFVAGLTYLFFILGLSLSGLIEFGAGWMNFGSKFADKGGVSGSFFTGTLAAVVASPCTAPLMGTALGFATTQPPLIALSIFAALGSGMALPVLVLSFSPKLLHKIPKPGKWMDHFKQILAFPLYATAVWLLWVVGNQTGVNGMALILLGCVLIALAIWLWISFAGNISKTLSAFAGAGAVAILLSPMLSPILASEEQKNWQPFSPQKLASLRSEGKPIFLNITAAWCITCLANEQVVLSSDAVKQSLIDNGVTYMKGDWTNYEPDITKLLQRYQRNGLPTYLYFPANGGEAILLPEILTQSVLLEALSSSPSSISGLMPKDAPG